MSRRTSRARKKARTMNKPYYPPQGATRHISMALGVALIRRQKQVWKHTIVENGIMTHRDRIIATWDGKCLRMGFNGMFDQTVIDRLNGATLAITGGPVCWTQEFVRRGNHPVNTWHVSRNGLFVAFLGRPVGPNTIITVFPVNDVTA